MDTAVVDDDAAINLDGRAIVGARGERVLAVAILVAVVAILFARTRYDQFVPPERSQTSPTRPVR